MTILGVGAFVCAISALLSLAGVVAYQRSDDAYLEDMDFPEGDRLYRQGSRLLRLSGTVLVVGLLLLATGVLA